MATVLMTNPPRRRTKTIAANPPGLALAVIGNPDRRSKSHGNTMKKRSRKHRARRQNPPAKSPASRKANAKRRATASEALSLGVQGLENPSSKFWRVGKRVPWKNPSRKYWRVSGRKPWRNPRHRGRRNPPVAASNGIMGDFAGLGAALADLKKHPAGLAWTAGGAAATAVAGNLVASQVAKVMPAMGPAVGRVLNAAVFAGVAVGASRLVKDPLKRRQMMAGGLAVAAIEMLSPGKTMTVVAKVPGLNRLLPSPAIGPDPSAALAAQRGMSGLGAYDVAEAEPIAIDGIADDDSMASDGESTPAALPAPETGGSMGELVPTYLNGLGCPLTGRSNDLTKLVTP